MRVFLWLCNLHQRYNYDQVAEFPFSWDGESQLRPRPRSPTHPYRQVNSAITLDKNKRCVEPELLMNTLASPRPLAVAGLTEQRNRDGPSERQQADSPSAPAAGRNLAAAQANLKTNIETHQVSWPTITRVGRQVASWPEQQHGLPPSLWMLYISL